MNHARGAVTAPSTTRSTADAFLEQHSLPLATRMSPVRASRVTTTRLVPRRRRLLGATLAAGGPSPQRSSAIMFEDNSRFHSNCVWVDRLCEERALVLLGCTADRPVQETRANFDNIGAVVAVLPRRDADQVASLVENSQRSEGQTPAWRSTRQGNSRSR